MIVLAVSNLTTLMHDLEAIQSIDTTKMSNDRDEQVKFVSEQLNIIFTRAHLDGIKTVLHAMKSPISSSLREFIELWESSKCDLNFLKQRKMKISKLTFIKFNSFLDYYAIISREDMYVDTDKGEKSYVTLNNVTTVECHGGFSEDAKQWIVNALHILNDSVLSTFTLPPVDSKIAEILNKIIQ
jgi:hypothetical protein